METFVLSPPERHIVARDFRDIDCLAPHQIHVVAVRMITWCEFNFPKSVLESLSFDVFTALWISGMILARPERGRRKRCRCAL
jgi:hypothetical protein